jgi:hypothetical protein
MCLKRRDAWVAKRDYNRDWRLSNRIVAQRLCNDGMDAETIAKLTRLAKEVYRLFENGGLAVMILALPPP